MKLLKEIGLLVLRHIQAAVRNPVFIIMGILSPLLYLALFTPILETVVSRGGLGVDNALKFFVSGMLPIMATTKGIFSGFGMIDEVRSGVLERFRVSPASRFAILMGPVFFDVITVLAQAVLYIVLSIPFGFEVVLSGLPLQFLFLALLTTISSTFGNTMGVILKNEDKYAPLVHGINLPILLLSGTLLPMQLAPGWLQVLAHLNPVYYVVEASRDLALGKLATTNVLYAFLVLIPFVAVTLHWATNLYKKVVT